MDSFLTQEISTKNERKRYDRRLLKPLAVILGALIILAGSMFYVLSKNSETVEEEFLDMAGETLREHGDSGKDHILAYINELKSSLRAIAILFAENDDPEYVDTCLQALNETYLEDCTFRYITAEEYEQSQAAGTIPEEDLKVYEQLTAGQEVETEIRYSKRLEGYFVGVAVPVFREETFAGAVYGNFNAENLMHLENDVTDPENVVHRYITDSDGTLLLLSENEGIDGAQLASGDNVYDKNVYGRSEAISEQIRQAYTQSGTSVIHMGWYEGEPEFLVVSDLEFNGYRYVICASMADISEYSSYVIRKNNRYFALLAAAFLFAGLVIILVIVTTHIQNRANMERYVLLGRFSDTVLFEYDCNRDVFRFTPNAEKLLKIHGLVIEQFSRRLEELNIFAGDAKAVAETLAAEPEAGQQELRLRFMRPDGTYFWGMVHFVYISANHRKQRIVGKIMDINDLKMREDILKERAERDVLTSLMNKDAVTRNVTEKLCDVRSGLLFIIDVDNFKSVNDTYGHPCGDQVLAAVARSIKRVFRVTDLAGRIGGDEMMVFVPGSGNAELAGKKSSYLFQCVKEELQRKKLPPVTISIGIARFPGDGAVFAELYDRADQALYRAKRRGKSQCCVYEEEKE